MPTDPPTGPSTHVTLETLADLDEGLLVPAQEHRILAHVAGCPDCSARIASVTGIRTALAAAPPERLPADVAARLDAALAGAGRPSRITPREIEPNRPRPTRWRPSGGLLATGAAASIVLLLFTAFVIGALKNGGGTAASTAGRDTAGTAHKAAADVPAGAVTTSGRDYTPATLRAALPALLARAGAVAQKPTTAAARAAAPGVAGDPSQLGQCVAELAGRGSVTPLAVDLARYAGQSAIVVVLPEAGRAEVLDVWVARPGCTRGDPQVIYFARLPRPAGIRSP